MDTLLKKLGLHSYFNYKHQNLCSKKYTEMVVTYFPYEEDGIFRTTAKPCVFLPKGAILSDATCRFVPDRLKRMLISYDPKTLKFDANKMSACYDIHCKVSSECENVRIVYVFDDDMRYVYKYIRVTKDIDIDEPLYMNRSIEFLLECYESCDFEFFTKFVNIKNEQHQKISRRELRAKYNAFMEDFGDFIISKCTSDSDIYKLFEYIEGKKKN